MLDESEYWRIDDVIRRDVEAAIKSHHAQMTINNLARAPTRKSTRRSTNFLGFGR